MRDNRIIVDEAGVFWSTRNGQKHHPIFPEGFEQKDAEGELSADQSMGKPKGHPAESQSAPFESLREEKAFETFKHG